MPVLSKVEAVRDAMAHNTQVQIITAISTVVVSSILFKRVYKVWRISQTKAIIRQEQRRCKGKLDRLKEALNSNGLSYNDRNDILQLTLPELQTKLQSRAITATAVLKAYQSAAMELNDKTNAVTEPITEAESIAADLDSSEHPVGPLHGIPITVKECFGLKGYHTTGGFSALLGRIHTEDAVLVQVMKAQGAVPFVRTNITQTMLTYESSNPIYGQTTHPLDISRNPGGSSSGEGALIGGGASILGLGTDVGGSIRVPCNNCGIAGLKPTAGRLSFKGSLVFKKGKHGIPSSAGPLARDVDSLVICMKSLLTPAMWELDPSSPNLPFNDEEYQSNRPLTIGYFVSTGYLDAVPSSVRAVMEAKEILEKCGHTFVPFVPPRMAEMVLVNVIAVLVGDGGETFKQYLKYDIWDPTLRFIDLNVWPAWLKVIVSGLYYVIRKPLRAKAIWNSMGMKPVFNWWTDLGVMEDWRNDVIQAMKDQHIDAIISPGFASPALPLAATCDIFGVVLYALLYNALNFPTGSLPVATVTKEDLDNLEENYKPRTNDEKNLKEGCRGGLGLPINVQCSSLHYKEELVLRIMKEIETGVQRNKAND